MVHVNVGFRFRVLALGFGIEVSAWAWGYKLGTLPEMLSGWTGFCDIMRAHEQNAVDVHRRFLLQSEIASTMHVQCIMIHKLLSATSVQFVGVLMMKRHNLLSSAVWHIVYSIGDGGTGGCWFYSWDILKQQQPHLGSAGGGI